MANGCDVNTPTHIPLLPPLHHTCSVEAILLCLSRHTLLLLLFWIDAPLAVSAQLFWADLAVRGSKYKQWSPGWACARGGCSGGPLSTPPALGNPLPGGGLPHRAGVGQVEEVLRRADCPAIALAPAICRPHIFGCSFFHYFARKSWITRIGNKNFEERGGGARGRPRGGLRDEDFHRGRGILS